MNLNRICVLAAPIAILILFGSALIGKDALAFRDVGHFYTPLYDYVAYRTSQSWLPLWNPLDATGMPLLGETTTAVLYPPRQWIFALPVSTDIAMSIYVVLHLILASCCATLAARWAGASRQAARIAGVIYPLSGSVLFLYTNPPFLVGASWLMLMAWPWMVVSVSFWLSVAATLGVMSVAPRLKQGLERIGLLGLGEKHEGQEIQVKDGGEKKGVLTCFISQVHRMIDFIRTTARQDLATTLGATLMTMPIIVILFERVSLISPLANVLLLWLIPPIMAVGSLVGLLGWFEPVARVLSFVGYPLVKLYVSGVEWLGSVPMAQVELSGIGWVAGWGWWLVIGGLVIKAGRVEGK